MHAVHHHHHHREDSDGFRLVVPHYTLAVAKRHSFRGCEQKPTWGYWRFAFDDFCYDIRATVRCADSGGVVGTVLTYGVVWTVFISRARGRRAIIINTLRGVIASVRDAVGLGFGSSTSCQLRRRVRGSRVSPLSHLYFVLGTRRTHQRS